MLGLFLVSYGEKLEENVGSQEAGTWAVRPLPALCSLSKRRWRLARNEELEKWIHLRLRAKSLKKRLLVGSFDLTQSGEQKSQAKNNSHRMRFLELILSRQKRWGTNTCTCPASGLRRDAQCTDLACPVPPEVRDGGVRRIQDVWTVELKPMLGWPVQTRANPCKQFPTSGWNGLPVATVIRPWSNAACRTPTKCFYLELKVGTVSSQGMSSLQVQGQEFQKTAGTHQEIQ